MLGLFDSGLGGLTVLRRVREALPLHDMLFFADQAHVPYGDRTPADLLRLVQQNLAWLDAEGAAAIVMACNSTCATASEFGWPHTNAPILNLIESAAIAVERGGFKKIGVVATAATARSGAYKRHIQAHLPGTDVIEIGAPALVPLVEAGKLHGAETAQAVAQACAPLHGIVDAVVLGCTHYPLLTEHFQNQFADEAPVIDPAIVHAERTAEMVERLHIPAGTGKIVCTTSGDVLAFEASLRLLIGDLSPVVRYLEPAEG